MNCNVHHDREASIRCFVCGAVICKECATENEGRVICKKCSENHVPQAKNKGGNINKQRKSNNYGRRHSAFWTFVFSLIPGAGQMYLGLMKRGLQLMFFFTIPIALATVFYLGGWLVIFNVIIWFYSFFDCQHIRRAINEGEEVEDKLVYDVNMVDLADLKGLNYKHVGIGLVVAGGLIILNNGLGQLTHYISRYLPNAYGMIRFMRQSSFPVLLIIIGIYLLKKSKVQKEA